MSGLQIWMGRTSPVKAEPGRYLKLKAIIFELHDAMPSCPSYFSPPWLDSTKLPYSLNPTHTFAKTMFNGRVY